MLFFLDIFDWAVTLCIFNFAFFFLISSWKSIIDHLLTHEKTMFKDLMSKFFCVNVHISHTLKDRCLLVIMSFYHISERGSNFLWCSFSHKLYCDA